MRHYHPMETDRWKNILDLSRWILEMRVNSTTLSLEREDPRAHGLQLSLLRESYKDSRFLHEFLGYRKLTKLEQQAAELLKELPASTGPQSP